MRQPLWWRAVWVAAAGLLLALQVLAHWVPPLQSPDELSHLIRVAGLAEGEVRPSTEPNASTGNRFDVALAALAQVYVPVIRQPNPDVSTEEVQAAKSQRWTGRLMFGEAPGAAIYMPVIYAPAATGLAIGQALDWTVVDSYHLARLSSQLFCVAVMVLAAWIWLPPVLAWAVLLLPMSLFQLLSPVVDGPAHALTLLGLSLLMRLRTEPRAVWVWSTAACLLVLVTARLHLLPLLLLPLWWAWRKPWAAPDAQEGSAVAWDDQARRTLVWAGASILTGVLLWTAWAASTVVDTRVTREVGPGAVAAHYLQHPQDVWAVFWRTLQDEHRPQFLLDSFIGNLGWLDTRLPDEAYPILWWGLAAMALLSLPWRGVWRGSVADRLVLALCALASCALAFMLMLITWSPFPADLIEGVQGRYFIAPALVWAYAAGAWLGPASAMGRSAARPTGALAGVLVVLALLVFAGLSMDFLAETLQARYPAWARGGLFK
jgi:uncharacterized membrane protein